MGQGLAAMTKLCQVFDTLYTYVAGRSMHTDSSTNVDQLARTLSSPHLPGGWRSVETTRLSF